jgi:hypothetical protein
MRETIDLADFPSDQQENIAEPDEGARANDGNCQD